MRWCGTDSSHLWTDEVRTGRCDVSKHDASMMAVWWRGAAKTKHDATSLTGSHCSVMSSQNIEAGDQRDRQEQHNHDVDVQAQYAAFMGLASPTVAKERKGVQTAELARKERKKQRYTPHKRTMYLVHHQKHAPGWSVAVSTTEFTPFSVIMCAMARNPCRLWDYTCTFFDGCSRTISALCRESRLMKARHCMTDKKAMLSQRWPRDAPYIWMPWKISGVPG